MRVEEQSTVSLSAIAYKGSIVTAKVNGKSVELKEVDGQTDGIDPNSSYTKYVGKYTAPEGVKGQDIDLGNVVFYGTYPTKTGDINESRTGAHIIVNALAEILNDYSGQLLVVNNDNTMVYNSKTTDTSPTPDMARLPAGTLDYIVSTVNYDGTDYYLTNTGKRLKTSAVSVQDNRPLGSNPISVSSVYKEGTDTVIKFKTVSKIPFSIKYDGQNYENGDNGDFYVSSFNATGITITFDYITSISAGDITFPDTAVFTTGTWSTQQADEMTRTMLSLDFRQTGIFSGVTTSYDSEGCLTFRFNGCRSSVSGATIVIDPGHGYTGKSAFDPGAVGHIKEQTANLAIAKYLAEILESMGANVIRFKTESETYRTEERSSVARKYNPDMFISVHCNAAGETATGAEAYYFTPFSQPLADCVSAELGSYIKSNVHSDGNGDRGEKYNYFWVTLQQDFPSILVETAYVTNYTEAMALADSGHQRKFAQAIADGVENYFARCNYSSYGDGYGTVGGAVSDGSGSENSYPPDESLFVDIPDENINTDIPSETLPPLTEETISFETTLPPGYEPNDPYYQYFFGIVS